MNPEFSTNAILHGEHHEPLVEGVPHLEQWRVFTETIIPLAGKRFDIDKHDTYARLLFNPYTGDRKPMLQSQIDQLRAKGKNGGASGTA